MAFLSYSFRQILGRKIGVTDHERQPYGFRPSARSGPVRSSSLFRFCYMILVSEVLAIAHVRLHAHGCLPLVGHYFFGVFLFFSIGGTRGIEFPVTCAIQHLVYFVRADSQARESAESDKLLFVFCRRRVRKSVSIYYAGRVSFGVCCLSLSLPVSRCALIKEGNDDRSIVDFSRRCVSRCSLTKMNRCARLKSVGCVK